MKISDLLPVRFKNYALCERGLQVNTFKQIAATLRTVCEFTRTEEVSELTTNILRNFLHNGRIERAWSPKTFRFHWQNLKTFFDWCVKNGIVKSNPVEPIERPKLEKRLPRCISREDAQKMLYHASFHRWTYEIERTRNHAIMATFLFSGLRHQELLNLEIGDVSLHGEEIFVKQGKNRKDRIVPMHPRLIPILREYFAARQKLVTAPSQWFFYSIRGMKLQQRDIKRIYQTIANDSGVYFTPHMLRHTFAKLAIEGDLNLFKLKEIMGHEQITTTQGYLSIATDNIKKSFSKIKLL